MTPDEVSYWQDQAALLDPDAYEFVIGTSQSRTVPGGENWYAVTGWFVQATGGGLSWFARPTHVRNARPLSEGTTIVTSATEANSSMYLCKPALVTGSDARYSSDPRGLYFERLRKIASTLTQYQIGGVDTGTSGTTVAFPSDFTDGLLIHCAQQDIAWMTLLETGGAGAFGGLNEISDTDPVRFAEPNLVPFKRTTVPNVHVRGAGLAGGRGTFTYLKLDGSGW